MKTLEIIIEQRKKVIDIHKKAVILSLANRSKLDTFEFFQLRKYNINELDSSGYFVTDCGQFHGIIAHRICIICVWATRWVVMFTMFHLWISRKIGADSTHGRR